MEELLVLSLVFGLIAIGYVLCVILPPAAVRTQLDLAPARSDLRPLLRAVLGAPESAEDLDLIGAALELRRAAERAAQAPEGG